MPLAKDRCCTGEVCLIQALVTFSCCLVPCSPVMKPTKIESVRLSLTRQHFIMFPVGSRTGQGEQRPLELRLLPATSSASQPADGAETAKGRGGRGRCWRRRLCSSCLFPSKACHGSFDAARRHEHVCCALFLGDGAHENGGPALSCWGHCASVMSGATITLSMYFCV